MLLRNSISNTKKFIQRTFDSFKSLLNKGNMYQRLPNDGDTNTSYKDLDNFYSEFTHQWDSNKTRVKNKTQKKPLFTTTRKTQEFYADTSKKTEELCSENHAQFLNNKTINYANKGKRESSDLCSRSVRERRLCLVAEKLKKLELNYDEGSATSDHMMDVEEILHYYSRLTCPAYLDIVDKFFTEMCSEFLGSKASPQVGLI